MRSCHGRLLRGGRPHDRFLSHVWLVAAGDRLRPSKARATLRAILGRKGLDVLGAAGPSQIEQSRRFWGVPKFDLVQVHNLLAWKAHLQTLFQMKAAGAVRYVGITTSEGRRHDLLEQIMRNEPIDFVQFSYNVVDREAEARLLPLAAERGIAVIVNRPFRQGALTDRLKSEPLPEWAAELGVSSWAQLMLKFILAHPAVTVAIPATTRVDHVRENLSAAAGPMPDLAMRQRISAHVKASLMSEWWTYRAEDFLLFSPRVYWRMFELHNAALWPLHLLTLAAGLLIILLIAWRPGTGTLARTHPRDPVDLRRVGLPVESLRDHQLGCRLYRAGFRR